MLAIARDCALDTFLQSYSPNGAQPSACLFDVESTVAPVETDLPATERGSIPKGTHVTCHK